MLKNQIANFLASWVVFRLFRPIQALAGAAWMILLTPLLVYMDVGRVFGVGLIVGVISFLLSLPRTIRRFDRLGELSAFLHVFEGYESLQAHQLPQVPILFIHYLFNTTCRILQMLRQSRSNYYTIMPLRLLRLLNLDIHQGLFE